MIKVLENEFYYLDNFQRVLDWIAQRYEDLLIDEERAFIAAFPALPRPARALFVRMVMRKGELFRASKLSYAEIGCPLEAARALAPTGWVELDPVMNIDELFDLVVKPEIALIFQLKMHQNGAKKAEQLASLRPEFDDSRRFSNWYRDCPDTALRILVKPLCDRLRLIFFGNLHQDWTEFVLSDLGIYRFEQVEFSRASRGFRSRRDIELYLQIHACKERFDGGESPDAVLPDLPPRAPDNEWLASRREKLLYQIGQHYEKQKDYARAHDAYRDCAFTGARARAIRVLEKAARYAEAHALLLQAEAAPESDAERQHLLRIAPRLARKLGLPGSKARRPQPAERIDLCLPMPAGDWWVEGVVRDHLAHDEAPVFYVENALANAMFGLLCWPAIFCAIPGAFFHPFHRAPSDLHSPDFYQRRADQFDACLAQLDDGRYRATILRHFGEKSGIQSPFLLWDYLDQALLELALDCIPAEHLKRWCERILHDVKANRSGFPDLIQFWPAERRYRMIEVKGPGDRLQDNQLRWIDYCATHRMPVAVCYLQWEQSA
ncbi:nuclease Fan1 [Massilia terrae]|uniref:phosphodiesterase I n=1 Tax=Massilia terrae TaxID=1811224 RepID=A0ABT2D3P0_9BURK|nr:VRR-NUC domain-containing protein [Massilia terrae]MCS0660005.1 VRR-NUC domain-containing protein [Massilia terrae]